MRLKSRGSVSSQPQTSHPALGGPRRATAPPRAGGRRGSAACTCRHSHQRVGEPGRWPEASHVRGCWMIAESSATTSSRCWTIARHHASTTLFFSSDAVVPVVVRVRDPAVDLRGGEDEPAPLAQRDDLVHRDGVGHGIAGAVYARTYTPAPPMPIYEYRCENGHLFEVMQRITDDPVTALRDLRGPGAARLPPDRRPLQGLRLLQHGLRHRQAQARAWTRRPRPRPTSTTRQQKGKQKDKKADAPPRPRRTPARAAARARDEPPRAAPPPRGRISEADRP